MEVLKTGALERYRQRDLPALIDLYEGNYLRAMRLLPDLDSLEGTLVSRVAGALDLYATIEERFKYTTTVLLTYRFADESGMALEPRSSLAIAAASARVRRASGCGDACPSSTVVGK